ncbi:hypothetical protein CMV_011771 [Castanea mollissima]|uniref:Calcineurin-like phosphoesterase domain-containing protein n=1 Tax=Castanea mollissima TaxID=60419 RepID=A0A8J4VZR8_9ROSI|nr:hypothetical protein CMV_011771 [Castanea mollissima]
MEKEKPNNINSALTTCQQVPNLLSSFVDTFVDFSVSGGLFLPNYQNTPHSNAPVDNQNYENALKTRYPTPPSRLVAIGDLHGDLEKSKEALRLANLINNSGDWTGGSTTVVQIGDVLDRGGDEIKILYFLERLRRQAARAGGEVITMNGNHEIMNVCRDFRCVSKSGLEEFRVWAEWYRVGQVMKTLCEGLENPKNIFEGIPKSLCRVNYNDDEAFVEGIRARIAALRPSGPISARFLSKNATVLVIGDSVFVHGGLKPEHVYYGLEKINEDVRDWINGLGENYTLKHFAKKKDAVVWMRDFSDDSKRKCDCSALEFLLNTIPGARRMIMGHTIQKNGINGACENRAIRIDVGMSKGCGNRLPEEGRAWVVDSGTRIKTSGSEGLGVWVVELPMLHPEKFVKLGIDHHKGVLCYGPPGTGKTPLAKAVANRTDACFIQVIGSELVQRYIGMGAKMVRELFQMAHSKKACIKFFD